MECDYHFIIKELAKEFEGPFECIGENSEIYKSFSVPIKKEVIIIDKESNKPVETISYKTEFIHSMRFMATSLSKLVDNLPEIYGKKCRDKNCKSECEFKGFKNNKRSYNCKKCRIEQLKPMNGLSKTFSNTYKFCNGNTNKFILLMRKGDCRYEYMDGWERFNKASLPEKEAFYIELNLEDITHEDYIHAQKVFEESKFKNLGEYHDLYLRSDVLVLTNVFKNFRNMCLEIYELDPTKFVSAPGLVWQAALKKIQIKLDLTQILQVFND